MLSLPEDISQRCDSRCVLNEKRLLGNLKLLFIELYRCALLRHAQNTILITHKFEYDCVI